MKKFNLTTNLGNQIEAILENDELIYGVTAVMIGCSTSYHNECEEGLVTNEYIEHPLTGEKLNIIAVQQENLKDHAIMMVPAHIQEHFVLAKLYGITYKQVVAPYFLGKDEEAINPEADTQFRRSVIAVIRDPKTNKYLCVDAVKRVCRSFVMGGIEGDESPEEATIREVAEETGYSDININYTSMFVLHNHFYAAYKGVNRYAHLYVVFGELASDKHEELSEEESSKQRELWLSKEELADFLSVNNNIFVYNYLIDGDRAYEGDGMMMNSGDMDGKLRSDLIDKK